MQIAFTGYSSNTASQCSLHFTDCYLAMGMTGRMSKDLLKMQPVNVRTELRTFQDDGTERYLLNSVELQHSCHCEEIGRRRDYSSTGSEVVAVDQIDDCRSA